MPLRNSRGPTSTDRHLNRTKLRQDQRLILPYFFTARDCSESLRVFGSRQARGGRRPQLPRRRQGDDLLVGWTPALMRARQIAQAHQELADDLAAGAGGRTGRVASPVPAELVPGAACARGLFFVACLMTCEVARSIGRMDYAPGVTTAFTMAFTPFHRQGQCLRFGSLC